MVWVFLPLARRVEPLPPCPPRGALLLPAFPPTSLRSRAVPAASAAGRSASLPRTPPCKSSLPRTPPCKSTLPRTPHCISSLPHTPPCISTHIAQLHPACPPTSHNSALHILAQRTNHPANQRSGAASPRCRRVASHKSLRRRRLSPSASVNAPWLRARRVFFSLRRRLSPPNEREKKRLALASHAPPCPFGVSDWWLSSGALRMPPCRGRSPASSRPIVSHRASLY